MTFRGKVLANMMSQTLENALNNPSSINPKEYAASLAMYLGIMTILPDEDKTYVTETYLQKLVEIGQEQMWDLSMLNLDYLSIIPDNVKAKALADFGISCDSKEDVNETFKLVTKNFVDELSNEFFQ